MSSILDKPSVRQAALQISVEQYHRLSAEGIIPESTELLRGVIIERMTKSPLHTYTVQVILEWLESAVGAGCYIRKDEPLTLSDSEPEPDVALVRGEPKDYRLQHPNGAELIVEVAIATLLLDRDKAEVYAAAGIPEYWIVIPEDQAVEVYRDPLPGGYQSAERITDPDSTLCPLSLPQGGVLLSKIVGPVKS